MDVHSSKHDAPGNPSKGGHGISRPLYPTPPEPPEARKVVRGTLEVIRRGLWLIVAVFLVVLAAAVAYTWNMPEPTYTATAVLMVDTQPSSSSQEPWSYGVVDARTAGSRNLNNEVLVLQQSLAIAERTAERLLAMEGTGEFDEPFSFGSRSARETAVLLQSGYITVTTITDRGQIVNDAIRVSASSPNPDEAVLIANVYAEEYVNRTTQESRQRIVTSREFLEEQAARRKEELSRWEAQIEQMGRAGAVALDAETQRTIGQIAQLEAQLDESRVELSMREASLASAEQELQQLHPKLVERMASGLEKEIELTQQKIAELELVIGDYNSRQPAAQNASGGAELNDLTRHVDQLKGRLRELSDQQVEQILASGGLDPRGQANGYVAQLNQQMVDERIAISGIEAKISALERRLASYSQKLDNIPQQSMQLAQVHRGRQTAEQMYLRLTEKLEEANLAVESEIGFAEILRPALAAYGPPTDPRVQLLIFGALLGLLLGFAAAFARSKLDVRIYTPDDVQERDFGLLSTIPDMSSIMKKEFGRKSTVKMDGREVSTVLLPLLRPQTAASEAYRKLYLSVQFSRPDVVVQTILVTSPEAGAGKSTTALNLAATAARTGRRTLIVDADLRQPSVHSYLGRPSSPGLSDFVREPIQDVEVDQLSTGSENLFVLPAGKYVSDPTRLLSSRAMRELIERLRNVFDVIIFDSPPVLLATDAALISTQSDVTVVVASAGSTGADALKQATDELRNVGAPVVGTILNRFDPTYMYGYKNTYGYRYKYEYGAR